MISQNLSFLVIHQDLYLLPSFRESAGKEPLSSSSAPSWRNTRSKSSGTLLQECSSASMGSFGRTSVLRGLWAVNRDLPS